MGNVVQPYNWEECYPECTVQAMGTHIYAKLERIDDFIQCKAVSSLILEYSSSSRIFILGNDSDYVERGADNKVLMFTPSLSTTGVWNVISNLVFPGGNGLSCSKNVISNLVFPGGNGLSCSKIWDHKIVSYIPGRDNISIRDINDICKTKDVAVFTAEEARIHMNGAVQFQYEPCSLYVAFGWNFATSQDQQHYYALRCSPPALVRPGRRAQHAAVPCLLFKLIETLDGPKMLQMRTPDQCFKQARLYIVPSAPLDSAPATEALIIFSAADDTFAVATSSCLKQLPSVDPKVYTSRSIGSTESSRLQAATPTPLIDNASVSQVVEWSLCKSTHYLRMDACSTTIGSSIFICGGEDHQHATLGLCEMINVDTNVCTRVAPLRVPRRKATAVTCEGSVFVLCGISGKHIGPTPLTQVERYDVQLNKWAFVASMPKHRFNSVAVVI